MRSRILALLGAAALPAALLSAPAVAAVGQSGPAVLHVGQIAQENVPPRRGSEPDTLVEPDIAVSPVNPQIAVSVFHDGRYSDGGAVDIGYAWTTNGGRTWRNAPVPYLTQAVGGDWPRASDPVLAFAADGSVYLSVLVFRPYGCPTGITVQRSTNGGATWSRPVLAHTSTRCTFSDDKNWITVDRQPGSPHFGRIYQFWTPFRYTAAGQYLGSPQVVRWSDDKGRHWSGTHYVNGQGESTQDSQPMIRPDGTLVDTYMRYPAGSHDDPEHHAGNEAAASGAAAASNSVAFVARTSTDGGATWSGESVITPNLGGGATGVRCCLPSAIDDPVTGALYANWIGAGPGQPILLSTSRNGRQWSTPVRADRDGTGADVQHVNTDVSAYGGRVYISYGTRSVATADSSRYVQQHVATSYDGGASFPSRVALGPVSDLNYAAFARGFFPGDYIGSAATGSRVYLAWARSSPPPGGKGQYHQTMYSATLAP